jgi:hypothetical protein
MQPMSVPESIAWLEVSRDSKSPSSAQIYATTILGELERLSTAADTCARELESRDQLYREALAKQRSAEGLFHDLEQKTITAREEWDHVRHDLESRLSDATERLRVAENLLRDTHYALMKQPDHTREDIATLIANIVTPYSEGEKP